MSKQVLRMSYHPAMKQVKFERFQDNEIIAIPDESRLTQYSGKEFVLQNQGNEFFSDIAYTFDAETIVHIDVITTKLDYKDFVQMVDYYNADASDVEIKINLLAELPDMKTAFIEVEKYGNECCKILKSEQTTFSKVLSKDSPDAVRKSVLSFSDVIETEIKNIKSKINEMTEKNVNLCFAGVYSAGKSALINAILGYAILPESADSKTARMFTISTPQNNEEVCIIFTINGECTKLVWDNIGNKFEFVRGPRENITRKEIQNTINKNANEKQFRQIHEILNTLNGDKNKPDNGVSPEVKVNFPIPLDNDNIQFTIYDTPGTDSDYEEHQQVLKKAFESQTHSILIFVGAPNKLEGTGSSSLLDYLNEAEKKSSKTSIDIGRSLFVINFCDSFGPTDLSLQKNSVIKLKQKAQKVSDSQNVTLQEIPDDNEDIYEIKLSDKKMFFTTAKYAYAAKAKKNAILTDSEDRNFEVEYNLPKLFHEELGRYYQYDRCALSELATKNLIENSSIRLEKAISTKDELEKMHICSGVYALEQEIIDYGQKFASAVKTYAIIKSVNDTLKLLYKKASVIKESNDFDIKKCNSEIASLKSTLENGIKSATTKYILNNSYLPEDILTKLHLDRYSIYKLISDPKAQIDALLKGRFFGLGKVKFDNSHKNSIARIINFAIKSYTEEFLINREKTLTQTRDCFIKDVQDVIRKNGDISEAGKKAMEVIDPPKIDEPTYQDSKINTAYDRNKKTESFLIFWEREYLDKEGFMQDIEKQLTEFAENQSNEFQKEYCNALSCLQKKIQTKFEQNLEDYSVTLQSIIADRESMMDFGVKISATADELKHCEEKLQKIIWSEIDNGK